MKNLIILISFILFSITGLALTPIEGLILGRIDDDLLQDPLNYIFYSDDNLQSKTSNELNDLGEYIGFYDTGINLKESCRTQQKIYYNTTWEHEQVKRSLYATLQYIGLDISSRALGKYAKEFEFSEEEYSNLIENLIGNYCSSNISIISLRNLKENLLNYYKDSDFVIPELKNKSFFSSKLVDLVDTKFAKENEFKLTIDLFRSFCSWGNDIDNIRLMYPFIHDPFIMSFIFRQMDAKKIKYDAFSKKSSVVSNENTIQVLCEDFICRRTDSKEFYKKLPKAIGHKNYKDDFDRLYCSELRDIEHRNREKNESIKKILAERTIEIDNLLRSHFLALITSIPDIFISLNKFSDIKNLLKTSIKDTTTSWALKALNRLSKNLFFEESVRIEAIDRDKFFNIYRPEFKIILEISQGELDRASEFVDKISATFYVKLSKQFLKWLKGIVSKYSPHTKEYQDAMLRLKYNLTYQLEEKRKLFIIPAWEGDLVSVVAEELMIQIEQYRGDFFKHASNEVLDIPIEFRYSPFALKYFRDRYYIDKSIKKIK